MATARRRRLIVPKDTFDYYDLVIYAARNSSSARALANALKARRWFENPPDRYARRRPFFRGRPNPTIVNWGSTVRPEWGLVREVVRLAEQRNQFLNSSTAVAKAINKLETFKCLTEAEVPVVKWTTEWDQVQKWRKKGFDVFLRKNLVGSSGAGIHILKADPAAQTGPAQKQDAPLYTRNYPKTHEFRVHVLDGKVIDFVEKKAKVDGNNNPVANPDLRLVRNHANGWVFAHEALSGSQQAHTGIKQIAIDSCRALGLSFGAVDVLAILTNEANRQLKSAVVCEVNTAPGLECTQTIEAYTTAIRSKHIELRGGR